MDPCAWTFSGQGTNALRAIPVYDSLIRLNNLNVWLYNATQCLNLVIF